MKELDRATLSTEQKLGLLLCANIGPHGERDVDDAIEMIRDHRLGSVWVAFNHPKRDEMIARVREAADYPILIMCDAENGHPGYTIPAAIALSAAGAREDYAFAFGRITATCRAALGYNVICSPVLDRITGNAPCGATTRTISPKKETVARLGAAICRGMHDGGTLAVAKHYPSGLKKKPYDSHMREGFGEDTREDLLNESLYPYRELLSEDLIDGIMVGHGLYPNIDPDRPASLSRPVMDILREVGFDKFYITDALNMMGVVLKYGNHKTTPMAVGAGCDIPLSWGIPCREAYAALLEGYRDGTVTDEQLELSVGRVLEAQHRAALLPKDTKILPEDEECIRRISCECISGVIEEGLTPAIPRDGKHLFILMTDGTVSIESAAYDAFANKWYNPPRIADKIRELFPNSGVMTHPEYPNYEQNMILFQKQQEYDDIVYVTYYSPMCFIGRECLTARTVDMMDALQSTDRIVAHLHFGNPFVATDAPYVPRVLLGWTSGACVEHTLKILAGEAELLGTQPYADYLRFHKKGDVIY